MIIISLLRWTKMITVHCRAPKCPCCARRAICGQIFRIGTVRYAKACDACADMGQL